MFDPFGDFDTAGYLRHVSAIKDPRIVMEMEDFALRANIQVALDHLAVRRVLDYRAYLQVYRQLFDTFYPWAGMDRVQLAPQLAISKAGIFFCDPLDCRRAVEHGLELGSQVDVMRARPGEVMGLFAYGHPFLDGNGRTMLRVHTELCSRAGFAIDWQQPRKDDYLARLSEELERPGKGILDQYLQPYIIPAVPRERWQRTLYAIPGLRGKGDSDLEAGDIEAPEVQAGYQAFAARRCYRID